MTNLIWRKHDDAIKMKPRAIDSFLDETKQVIDSYIKDFIENASTQETAPAYQSFVDQEMDYLQHVKFVGTAHFSSRSVHDVLEALSDTRSVGVCLELCPYRYEYLIHMCNYCLEKGACSKSCEFIAAIEALEKTNTDVWLIDMNQVEITARVLATSSADEARAWQRMQRHIDQREAYGIRLWEEGLKDEALALFNGNLELMKKTFPTLWRVLIIERNILMACRLIYLISQYLKKELGDFRLIVFTGATHVDGLKELLKSPQKAFELLDRFGLAFSQPNLVKRG